MHAIEFQRKWRDASVKERSGAQEHFIDICRLVGAPTPVEADPAGEFYAFEKGAEKLGGGEGWADVWYRDHFAWEYKGRGRDLVKAYQQLNLYRENLENPPLLVVSDLDVIEVHTNFTGTVKQVHRVTTETIADEQSLRVLRALFFAPQTLRPTQTPEGVTKEAAARFGELAKRIHERGNSPEAIAHFLVQVLFCLFAEDIGLLPNRVFSRLLDFARQNPTEFRDETQHLLEAMGSGGSVAYEIIPHFNGGLFRTVDAIELTSDEIDELDAASHLDWSQVEPAIFGTLFERSLDPEARSRYGVHYTGRADIERVVAPVVLEPLRRRWDEVRTELDDLVARRDVTTDRSARTRLQNRIRSTLQSFMEELSQVTVLDPACGSGNFLYVALNGLLDLEKEALTYGATNAGQSMGLPAVGPHQVIGMELNGYAHELAQVAIWIGYLQWMIGNGFGWREPVLRDLQNIRLQDALLDEKNAGEMRRTAWPKADYIVGNPPFLGGKVLRSELGDDYTEWLHRAFKGSIPPFSDLACYFFEQAREAIEEDRTKRAGLLATNSIRGGANREVLKRIKDTGDIFMAWADEPWVLAGAAVRISIIGFDDGTEQEKMLNGLPVGAIYSDLTAAIDITAADRLPENRAICYLGVQMSGPFDMDGKRARSMLGHPANPNGRLNGDVIKPVWNGIDVTRRPRDVWFVDFGVDMPLEEAAMFEAPFSYVEDHVKPMREKSRSRLRDDRWWLPVWNRPEMRAAIGKLNRFIVSPAVSKHRIFKWAHHPIVPNHALVVFARDDDYFFGLLHSRAHEVWSLRMGTSLEDRPRYTPSTTFETFALPWPPGQEPQSEPRVEAIADAAKRLDELRERWLNPEGASEAELKKRTLTKLYNARPTWLANAHAALDRAVWDAYGWPEEEIPGEVEEDVILGRLLVLNQERAEMSDT